MTVGREEEHPYEDCATAASSPSWRGSNSEARRTDEDCAYSDRQVQPLHFASEMLSLQLVDEASEMLLPQLGDEASVALDDRSKCSLRRGALLRDRLPSTPLGGWDRGAFGSLGGRRKRRSSGRSRSSCRSSTSSSSRRRSSRRSSTSYGRSTSGGVRPTGGPLAPASVCLVSLALVLLRYCVGRVHTLLLRRPHLDCSL